MKAVLVTGGAGFIGSHIGEALVKKGYEVRILDNLSTSNKDNLSGLSNHISFIEGDIRDYGCVEKAVTGTEYIFHTAAIRAVARSVDDPRETNEVNITGTLNLLMAARACKVKRVIYCSSSAAYGNLEEMPLRESMCPEPESPYGASKLMGEYYMRIFTQLYGLETVSLRYFNVYGPRQNPESKYSTVIPILISCLLKGESPPIHWDGKQSRDFIYVGDIVESNMCAMVEKNAVGKVFNIGTQTEESVIGIFKKLQKLMGKENVKPKFEPKRGGDVRKTLANVSLAKQDLHFEAKVSFSAGLKNTLEWFSGVTTPK
jgi:nucleoside-diphosphate-sugar epimerase